MAPAIYVEINIATTLTTLPTTGFNATTTTTGLINNTFTGNVAVNEAAPVVFNIKFANNFYATMFNGTNGYAGFTSNNGAFTNIKVFGYYTLVADKFNGTAASVKQGANITTNKDFDGTLTLADIYQNAITFTATKPTGVVEVTKLVSYIVQTDSGVNAIIAGTAATTPASEAKLPDAVIADFKNSEAYKASYLPPANTIAEIKDKCAKNVTNDTIIDATKAVTATGTVLTIPSGAIKFNSTTQVYYIIVDAGFINEKGPGIFKSGTKNYFAYPLYVNDPTCVRPVPSNGTTPVVPTNTTSNASSCLSNQFQNADKSCTTCPAECSACTSATVCTTC